MKRADEIKFKLITGDATVWTFSQLNRITNDLKEMLTAHKILAKFHNNKIDEELHAIVQNDRELAVRLAGLLDSLAVEHPNTLESANVISKTIRAAAVYGHAVALLKKIKASEVSS